VFAGIIVLVLSFIYWIVTFVVAAHIKGGAIQVTAKSWPELNAIVDEAKNKLGVSDAKAYVIQDSVFNAFATRLAGRNFVVLNSGAIDTLLRKGKIEDLKFLVGHECGHVAMGHVGFWNTSFAHLGAIIYPLYAWYRRCQERSADRCGLWCAGNRTDAHTSIAVLAGGSEMGSRLDINAVSAQWNEVRDETWIMIARYYSEYPHTLERILLVHQAADELRLP
jgi:Zn-dependent protease with chaperone function